MKQRKLKPDIITFNTLLRKTVQDKQPFNTILSLLDEIINLQIKPQVEGKKPYIILAVQDKIRRSQKPFKEWVHKTYPRLEKEPPLLREAWEEFFRQMWKEK